jgi:hypothetical protein
MAVMLSVLRAGRPLPPPPGRFLVLNFVRGWVRPQVHKAAGRIRSNEKIYLIGTRTRNLLACSIVPQPTTLPRAPYIFGTKTYGFTRLKFWSWNGLQNLYYRCSSNSVTSLVVVLLLESMQCYSIWILDLEIFLIICEVNCTCIFPFLCV